MNEFRRQVAAIMAATARLPRVLPAMDEQGRPTVRRGDQGDFVRIVQAAVGIPICGIFEAATERPCERSSAGTASSQMASSAARQRDGAPASAGDADR